jgi:hypothetical protein
MQDTKNAESNAPKTKANKVRKTQKIHQLPLMHKIIQFLENIRHFMFRESNLCKTNHNNKTTV